MKFIRLADVIAQTGLGRTTIYKLMGNDQFPKSVSLMPRTVVWVEEEVQDWILEKIALRDEKLNKQKITIPTGVAMLHL